MSLHDSSIIVPGYGAPAIPLQQREWDLTDPIPAKSTLMDYGYIIKDQAVGCTRQVLIETLVQRKKEISFVWTPESAEPVRPEQVPFLIESFRRLEVRRARNYMWWGAGLLIGSLMVAVDGWRGDAIDRSVYFVVGAFALAAGNWKYWRARNYTQEDAVSDASTARFETWIKARWLSGYTMSIMASILVVGAFQGLVGDAIARAGLVKPAVWDGEVWRVFTATLMHVSFYHFLMSFFGLIYIPNVVEQTIHRGFVPLLFLVSAVVGNVFSLILYPETSWMGATGGIMGLLGFIVIAAYLDRTKYPPRYFKRMLAVTVVLVALPAFGIGFLDSAAHLGGLVTGGTLGWLCTKGKGAPITGKLLWLGSAAGVLGIVSAAAFAIHRIIAN